MFESGPMATQVMKEMAAREQEIEGNLKKEEKKKKGLDAEVEKKIRELELKIEKASNMEEVQELELQIKALEDSKD